MEELIASVGIFVFASHDRDALKRYCKRFFKLGHGQVTEIASDEM